MVKEGIISLTPDERSQVEDLIPKIIEVISGDYIGDNMQLEVGEIDAISADKTPIKVKIFVGNNLNLKNADGYYQTNDPKNPTDNLILIQQFHFSPFFKGLSGLDAKVTKLATGNENIGLERLRKVLKHELIHAKDPAENQHYSNRGYRSDNDEIYYKSWTEFQTMTGQFFEAITTGVDRALRLGMSKNDILKALNNILQYYSGKTKIFNQEAKDFIQGSGKRNIFQSIINFFTNFKSAIEDYAEFLAVIKRYNPEGYKEFLKDLYKTVEKAKEELNKLNETSISLVNILNELVDDKEAEQQLQKAFTASSVENFVSQFKDIAKDPKVQAILKAGKTDEDPNDEIVKYTTKQLKVLNLLPTQNEIGFDQSIENIITDQYGSLESILKGKADVGGPIVTYNGKYVIDGHHRWSQVFAANPKATMDALDIQGSLKPKEILKIVHAAIAVKVGEVPSSDPKGINILNGVTEKQVSDKVNEKLTDKAKSVWASNGYKDNNSISNHIYKNLQSLISKNKPISDAPGRKDMPQTDYGDKSTKNTLDILGKGLVNFRNPKSTDVKELKRLQELAGILREEDPIVDKVEDELGNFLKTLEAGERTAKVSPKDKQINELAITLAALVVGAPGLLTLLGKGADAIGQYFSDGNINSTQIGKYLQKAGKKWEDRYIDSIAGWLEASFPSKFSGQNVHDKSSEISKYAHGVYAGMLGAAAIGSAGEAAKAVDIVIKGLEAGAASIKSAEVIQLAQQIAKA